VKRRLTTRNGLALAGCLAALAAGPASATDQALLDALVRKGVLTDQEAQQIEQEVSKEAAAPAPGLEGKLKLGDWVQELKLYGDLRLRGQYDAEQPQTP
jgi:polyhydroxyalkanoate synthesis regulator phasin